LEGPDQWGAGGHPDYQPWIENARDARHKYDSESEQTRWFMVEDSAEGWAKVVEVLETAAWQEKHRDKLFIFDFSGVRAAGVPIAGQQGRPASGPVPFIHALVQLLTIRGAGLKPWKQAMFVDHYLAACVAVGGVRRAARLAARTWTEHDIFDFVEIKRGGFLTSANNSVMLDDVFWEQARSPLPTHGRRVFEAMTSAGYFDGTGEPGFVNAHLMSWCADGVEDLKIDTLFDPAVAARLRMHPRTYTMMGAMLDIAKRKKYPFIPNPCGEIILACWGAYCVIGDLCLANADTEDEVLEAGAELAKFLVRVNRLPTLYRAEVDRTNRIGVSQTGLHEFAFRVHGCTWHDLVNPTFTNGGSAFWDFQRRLRDTVTGMADAYSEKLGVPVPHTIGTMKPSGTIAKVMFCTEGAHLSAHAYYLRWVQYPAGSSELQDLQDRGYPVRDVSHAYPGHFIVGFPTCLPIADLMGDRVVLAGEATPEDQYEWLRLIEENWLGERGNQCSYTLKFNPAIVPYEHFMRLILDNQSTVRCCSLMAQADLSAYAYQPEEKIAQAEYYRVMGQISSPVRAEGYDADALSCESGACPIENDL
jgi:ribonucleoside-triphosphate reductase (formate)